jgi:hypothetical protein
MARYGTEPAWPQDHDGDPAARKDRGHLVAGREGRYGGTLFPEDGGP